MYSPSTKSARLHGYINTPHAAQRSHSRPAQGIRFAGVKYSKMMAMVKIAVLLLVVNVFTATALENFHGIGVDSIHELHPFPSEAPSPSKDAGEHHKAAIVCAMGCVAKCQDKQPWKQVFCIGVCLAQCTVGPSDSVPEIACALECAQSSTNNLRYEAKMDNRISACIQQCKNN